VPTTGQVVVTGNVTSLPASELEVLIYTSSTRGTIGTLRATLGATGTFTASATAAGIRQVSIIVRTNAAYSPATEKTITIADLKVYGVAGVSGATTSNVFTNIIDNEIDTDYLSAGAAYRAYIATEATAVEPLVFDSCDALTKLTELTKYAAYDYGWYCEPIQGSGSVCVPHWTARSTTPDYIIGLADAEGYDLDESALDELASVVRVNHTDPRGRAATTDVTDTDTTHPLVALGITRYHDVSAQTTSTATASAVGTLALAEVGRPQTKGSIVTRYVYTATGAPAYLPDIRPGQMVRVFGLADGKRDCIVRRVTCTSDRLASIELDNEGYALEVYLAKLAKREVR
jgi:hypothetical protein